MVSDRPLPPAFLARIRSLEAAYLAHDDPIRQSGFGGGARRWRAEREPILHAIASDSSVCSEIPCDLLDIGCANGYLLECLMEWARVCGPVLTPWGLDFNPRLIAAAKTRLPRFADHFFVANAWDWHPPRHFRCVYTLHDCVPPDLLAPYVRRLLQRVVAPGGRLIVGAYGSNSKSEPARDVAAALAASDFTLAGIASVGALPIAAFAWLDNRRGEAPGHLTTQGARP